MNKMKHKMLGRDFCANMHINLWIVYQTIYLFTRTTFQSYVLEKEDSLGESV